MDLYAFKNDKEIVQYLMEQLQKVSTLNECRLFEEEQLQITDEIIHFRNCIEWIIRSNQIITNIKYALTKSLEFAAAMSWPLEETENKRLYAYYLEDAVYRNLVLWDMFRQLLNEFYKCGYSESDSINIFRFLREKRSEIGIAKADTILNYLDDTDHKMVREKLRNSFTHSVESTSSYFFHRNYDGKIQPQMDYLLPRHPFENLNFVITDVLKLIEFINETVSEMYEYRNKNLILLEVTIEMPCGKKDNDLEHWNLGRLIEQYENIIVPCENPCEKTHTYNEVHVCKPTKVHYQRIHSKQEQTSGTLTPTMTFTDIETAFGENEQ